MLKRKWTKGSGSQALIPEGKPEREAPVEQLWERSREGRKETNRELSKQNRKEADGKPGVEDGEERRGRKEPSLDEEPTVRRSGQRAERKKQRLSSWKGSRRDRKGTEAERKIPEARAEGKHLRNSCGSESGKGERKHTAKLSTGTGKECTGNQAGKNGEDRRSESESGALRRPL